METFKHVRHYKSIIFGQQLCKQTFSLNTLCTPDLCEPCSGQLMLLVHISRKSSKFGQQPFTLSASNSVWCFIRMHVMLWVLVDIQIFDSHYRSQNPRLNSSLPNRYRVTQLLGYGGQIVARCAIQADWKLTQTQLKKTGQIVFIYRKIWLS